MGGIGSGRHGRRSYLSTTQSQIVLQVSSLFTKNLFPVGQEDLIAWERNGELCFIVKVTRTKGEIELSYVFDHPENGPFYREYLVPILWSNCHYGGQRPWLNCPRSACQRRVGKLYLNEQGYFVCRHCAKLVYESQYEGLEEGLIRKADRIRERLSWRPGIINPGAGKPTNMHYSTYLRLLLEYDKLVTRAIQGWG